METGLSKLKQLLQSLKDGTVELAEIPAPEPKRGCLRIHTSHTLISAGTERMLAEFGQANWITRARSQPDKVKMVLDKAGTDGVLATFDAVRSKLDQPLTLGYCNVGRVESVGVDVSGFALGDRVVSNGSHAEVVVVPRNLCAKIPDSVSDEDASFTVLASIGLQGIRLANPTLGENVVVTGLGLIGLLTVQLLRAQGCRVLGIDPDPARLEIARSFGAATASTTDDVQSVASAFSRGNGVDAVIITASSRSNRLVSDAANMCRKRGRIVLVGQTGLELNRDEFYEKELTFQVSCSYGPGRYEPAYEERGQDYPLGFVRWTEQRNFEAVLDLMASGALDVQPLISHRYAIERADEAMALLTSDAPSLGIMLEFPRESAAANLFSPSVSLREKTTTGTGTVAFLGAGNHAGRALIPAFQKAGANLHTIVSAGGVSARHYGRKFGFAVASTRTDDVLENDEIDTVVIATRHDRHASEVLSALRAGKHVYCEKPLCLNTEDLEDIRFEAASRPEQILMVGFNRRFAPHVERMKSLIEPLSVPKHFAMTVNAGAIPSDHWTQDPTVGGGRIIGEACHFVDLLRHLAGAPITGFETAFANSTTTRDTGDTASIMLSFADGSAGVINYLANGHRSISKERLEVFAGGRVLTLDNFRKLTGYGWPGFSRMRLWRQDKGINACAAHFLNAVRTGTPPAISLDEQIEVSRVAIEAASRGNAGNLTINTSPAA